MLNWLLAQSGTTVMFAAGGGSTVRVTGLLVVVQPLAVAETV